MRKREVVIVSMGLLLLLMPSIKVKASEETPSQLYDKAVNENIINPNIYPK